MFSKPFRVKSNSQLKGSERKKFRAELLKNFSTLTEEDLPEIIQNKEVVISMKVLCHSGEHVLVYCVQKLPIVFEVDGIMFPTVYMLWKIPNLLYTFTTWPQVLPKITGGADLMLPGVVLKDGFHVKAFGKLEKGERVAVNLSNNSAPIAVGRTALSSMDMYMSAKRGKAVNILHFVGDELWGYGTKLPTPNLGPPEGFEVLGSDEEAEGTGSVENKSPDENEGLEQSKGDENIPNLCDLQIASNEPVQDESSVKLQEDNATDDGDIQNNLSISKEEPETSGVSGSTEQGEREIMDELVEYCFLKALNTSAKKADYPMLSSKFYKLHMLPACPSDKTLDIKKSSHKKLSVFLSKMNVLGVVSVKELTKGVESIMNVNVSHELIRNFVDIFAQDEAGASSSQMVALDSNCRPEITEMYVVTAAVLPIFSKFDLKKGASVPIATARKLITDYVKAESLQDANNKRLVKVNETLSNVLGNKEIESIQWDELFTKIISRMTRSYQMSFSGHSSVLNKGKLEPIDIQVGKRTGNKKVTLINNLELYGINLTEFARECQHGVAASTSISNVPGKKSAQLMVQGNQVLFVGNLLTGKYQIPKRYIRGLELAPKQKK
ncbi:hypothetical protein R5R35_001673 [Gryllus longicercus]|uniref:Ligatin n=1 Tax=Gryllus longicercus TaxID=2509291 RepID=A0AAN9Z0T5_9ORTH